MSDSRIADDDFPNEGIYVVIDFLGWRIYFDEVVNNFEYGIGVLLILSRANHIPRSTHLAFFDSYPTTNNILEYETCILGLETALKLGIR